MTIASDNAIFFADHVADGCGWHAVKGRMFLCRRNGSIWENALINHCRSFPESEMIDDSNESGTIDNILWVEPEHWKPLNLAPTESPEKGMVWITMMLKISRFGGLNAPNIDEKWNLFLSRCSGKTHREVLAHHHFG